VAGLATACSFDANRLRALPASAAGGSAELPDAIGSSGNDDTAIVPDVPVATPDALGDAGDTPIATGGVDGRDGPFEIGGTKYGDGPMATGGVAASDVPIAMDGAGGTGGAGDSMGALGGATTTTNSGGIGSDGVGGSDGGDEGGRVGSGGAIDTGGFGIGGDSAEAGGSGGSSGGSQPGDGGAGPVDAAGSDGSGVDAPADTSRGGYASGGIGGRMGTGGAGGNGIDAAADATDAGGNACNSQCPFIATIGITGPWGATYSNGASGDLVTPGDTTFLNWLAARSAPCPVQNLDITGSNYLTAARVAPFKVIVILDIAHTQADKDAFIKAKKAGTTTPAYPGTQRAILGSEANAIQNWVINNGGGLMTTMGYSLNAADVANTNLLLQGSGIAYSSTDFDVLTSGSTINSLSTSPPIASQITAGVNTLNVFGAAAVVGESGGTLPADSSSFSQYASGGGSCGRGGCRPGYTIGVAKVNGAGRLNIWGDEWITYDAAWTSAYDTQTYWKNVINWLGQCQ